MIKLNTPIIDDKINNLHFLLIAINYRLDLIKENNNIFMNNIEEYFEKYNYKIFLKENINETILNDNNSELFIEQQVIVEINKVYLIEFNSLITLLLSFFDNILDLYLTIKYKANKNGFHWDFGNFCNNKQIKIEEKDILNSIITTEMISKIKYIQEIRDCFIHRIAKSQKITFSFELHLNISKNLIKQEHKLKEITGDLKKNLYDISTEETMFIKGISKKILNELIL